MAPILLVRNLSTGYGKSSRRNGVPNPHSAIRIPQSSGVMPGEILLVTGGNDSGKSTLLKANYGLRPPWNADAEIIVRPDSNGRKTV